MTLLVPLTAPAQASHSDVAGHWRLDEGSGQVAHDSSGHGLDGRLGNSAGADAGDPFWTSGRIGSGALNFPAGARSVFLADSPLLEPAHLTVEAWVKRTGSPGRFAYVVAKGADSCVAASYALYSGWDGGLTFYVYDGSKYTLAPGAGSGIWDGEWHHVAGTFDGAMARFYVDGVEIGAGTPAPPIRYPLPSNEALDIGNFRGSCDKPFTGSIDNVRIWSRPLGAGELQDLASQPPGQPGGPGAGTPGAEGGKVVTRVACARRASFRRAGRSGVGLSVTLARTGRVRAFVLYRGRRIGSSRAVLARERGNIVMRVQLQRARVRRALRRHGRLQLSCRAAGSGQSAVASKRRLVLRP